MQQKEDSAERDTKLKVVEEEIATKLIKTQREKFEKEISKLKDLKAMKGKSAVVFNLKEKVLGSKKAQQEPAVIKNPDTDELVTEVEEIKKISL